MAMVAVGFVFTCPLMPLLSGYILAPHCTIVIRFPRQAVRTKTAQAGTTETNEFINVEDFFNNSVALHLQGKSHPVLVADAIKFVLTFRGHVSFQPVPAALWWPLYLILLFF